ncbi:MAG TPA: efflux transporter outer membrane subunit [Nitrospirota bacterium]|nr:efflux transporter outer membrane subunit [Nitrospirota bacterium]
MSPSCSLKTALALAACLAAAGCVVGPNYRTPGQPEVASYTSGSLPAETASAPGTAGAPQRLVPGRDIPAEWWTLFRSPELDRLIRQALAGNPNIAAAQATLRQAQELLQATIGAVVYPKVDAGASVVREKISGASLGQPNLVISPFTLYNASVNVSYSLDLFGGARRELESLESQIDAQKFLLEGARLTIASNVVTTAVQEASLRAQLDALREIVAAQEKELDLVQLQYRLGGAARIDVLFQRTQLAQTRALLPPLAKELSRTRHALTVLAGRFPVEAGQLPEFTLTGLTLPGELPLGIPSSLVRQRPDIRASEALLHAASAQIGVAESNRYPHITLTGSFGSLTTTAGDLLSGGTGVWNIGAGLLQPLFHGGEVSAKQRAAVAAYDQAEAQYRAVVLQAFGEVADVLRALEADANILQAQADAESAAHDTLELTRKQFQLGGANYLALLIADRQYLQTRINLVQAQAARFADTAALFQALGGGWWNRQTAAGSETK